MENTNRARSNILRFVDSKKPRDSERPKSKLNAGDLERITSIRKERIRSFNAKSKWLNSRFLELKSSHFKDYLDRFVDILEDDHCVNVFWWLRRTGIVSNTDFLLLEQIREGETDPMRSVFFPHEEEIITFRTWLNWDLGYIVREFPKDELDLNDLRCLGHTLQAKERCCVSVDHPEDIFCPLHYARIADFHDRVVFLLEKSAAEFERAEKLLDNFEHACAFVKVSDFDPSDLDVDEEADVDTNRLYEAAWRHFQKSADAAQVCNWVINGASFRHVTDADLRRGFESFVHEETLPTYIPADHELPIYTIIDPIVLGKKACVPELPPYDVFMA